MNFWRRYIAYLKDNPEGYWFKRKLFGWGWTPATREGWIVLALFLIVYAWMITHFITVNVDRAPTNADAIWFGVEIVAWVTALIFVCYKTGERPKWQWGFPDKKDTNV